MPHRLSNVNNLCITGASISRCPWPTWVDFLIESLTPTNIINYSAKGAGNSYIIHSAIHAVENLSENSVLSIMLTNFDKYDMWVKDDVCKSLFNERHSPRWIDGSVAHDFGFWCTGSHFPLIKQAYKENFFDINMSACTDLTQLLGLIKFCEDKKIKLIILFDSPILDYTEEQLNQFCRQNIPLDKPLDIKQHALTKSILSVLDPYIIDCNGLIGYCITNNLPWYNATYGAHPPSSSHWQYFDKIIIPKIHLMYPDLPYQLPGTEFISIVDKMTRRWEQSGF